MPTAPLYDSQSPPAAEKGVAAVDRALTIVFALEQAAQPQTLTQISAATGFYKSTVLRLLESLIQFALVVRLQDGTYMLGPAIMRLGLAYEGQNPIRRQIRPVLAEMVAEGTESPSFHIRHDEVSRLCILRLDSNHSTLDRVREGDVLPLKRGAAGRVIASAGTGALMEVSIGERDPACAGVAVPIFAAGQRFLGALSLSGPRERFSATDTEEMRPRLYQAARRLCTMFGGTFPG